MSDSELSRKLQARLDASQASEIDRIAKHSLEENDKLGRETSDEFLAVRNGAVMSEWMIAQARFQQSRRSIGRVLIGRPKPRIVEMGKYKDQESADDFMSSGGPAIVTKLFGQRTDYTEGGVIFGWQLQLHGWKYGNTGGIRIGRSAYDSNLHIARVVKHITSGKSEQQQHYEINPIAEIGKQIISHWAANDTELEVMREVALLKLGEDKCSPTAQFDETTPPYVVEAIRLLDETFNNPYQLIARALESVPTSGDKAITECLGITSLALNELVAHR